MTLLDDWAARAIDAEVKLDRIRALAIQEVTIGQGSYGKQCVLCKASDYMTPGRVTHHEKCPLA